MNSGPVANSGGCEEKDTWQYIISWFVWLSYTSDFTRSNAVRRLCKHQRDFIKDTFNHHMLPENVCTCKKHLA